MRAVVVLSLFCTASCRQVLGIEEAIVVTGDGGSSDADAGPPPECSVQRVVHLVAGNGSFGLFTLVWPVPTVVTGFQSTYAFDDPTTVKSIPGSHPLYVRKRNGLALWEGAGMAPLPTVMVAGSNETHSLTPSTIVRALPRGLDEAAAIAQAPLAAPVPVLAFGVAGPYDASTPAPAAVRVNSIDEAAAQIRARVPSIGNQLDVSVTQLDAYLPTSFTMEENEFARQLAFTSNALRHGVIGTAIIPVFNQDIHAVFDAAGTAGTRANNLTQALDVFYAELATATEPTCVYNGGPMSMLDNTVVYVTGDTPRNPYIRMDWPDASPGSANWIYIRSNGFLQTGWFGLIENGKRTNWDPTTGNNSAGVSNATSTTAAWAAALYAITRGNTATVRTYTGASLDGVSAQ